MFLSPPACLLPGPLDPGKTVLKIVGTEDITKKEALTFGGGGAVSKRDLGVSVHAQVVAVS